MAKLLSSIDIEKKVLGTFLIYPNSFSDFIDILSTEDFYDPKNKLVFNAIVLLFNQNKQFDDLLIYEEIQKIEANFSAAYITELQDFMGLPATLNEYGKTLRQYKKFRKLRSRLHSLIEIIDKGETSDRCVEEVERALADAYVPEKEDIPITTTVKNAFNAIQKRHEGHGLIRTGFDQLDELTGGFLPGQLIIIAARTSIGKTSFALSLAHNVMNYGKMVTFISLEMPNEELVLKSVSIESQVAYAAIRDHSLTSDQWLDITKEAQKISEWPFDLKDDLHTLREIKTYLRHTKKTKNTQLIIIDYLGLIEGPRFKDKYLEISEITRSLKMLARELQTPIVLLAQCNRETEKGAGDKRPHLHNLRDSGSIEQDADMVLLLYREYYYDKEASPYTAEINIAKQRLGETKTIQIGYVPTLMQFTNE